MITGLQGSAGGKPAMLHPSGYQKLLHRLATLTYQQLPHIHFTEGFSFPIPPLSAIYSSEDWKPAALQTATR